MRMKTFAFAVLVAVSVPTAAIANGVSGLYDHSVEDTRQNMKCRVEVKDMHTRMVPYEQMLLDRDITLNRTSGTMHTGDVQYMRDHIHDVFTRAAEKMRRLSDYAQCQRIADDTVDTVIDYVYEHAY